MHSNQMTGENKRILTKRVIINGNRIPLRSINNTLRFHFSKEH